MSLDKMDAPDFSGNHCLDFWCPPRPPTQELRGWCRWRWRFPAHCHRWSRRCWRSTRSSRSRRREKGGNTASTTHTHTQRLLAAHELCPLLTLKLLKEKKRKKKELWGVVVHFTTSSATDAATKCLTSVSPSGGGRERLSPQPVDGVIARRVKSPSLTSGETKEKCRSDVLVRHIFKSLLLHCIYMCMRFHADYFLPHPLTNYFSISVARVVNLWTWGFFFFFVKNNFLHTL